MDERARRRQVGRDAEEGKPAVGDVAVTGIVGVLEPLCDTAGGRGGQDGKRRDREPSGHEPMGPVDAGRVVEPPGHERAHERTDARAAHGIDRHTGRLEGPHDPQVGEPARAAASEDEPHRPTRELAGYAADVGVVAPSNVVVAARRQGVERRGGRARRPIGAVVQDDDGARAAVMQ
jgi:hypothetical protein